RGTRLVQQQVRQTLPHIAAKLVLFERAQQDSEPLQFRSVIVMDHPRLLKSASKRSTAAASPTQAMARGRWTIPASRRRVAIRVVVASTPIQSRRRRAELDRVPPRPGES